MIGLALGRIGCLLNGCCYGGQTDWPWAVTFPKYSSRYEAAKPPAQRRYSPPYADQASRGEMHGFRLDARRSNGQLSSRASSWLARRRGRPESWRRRSSASTARRIESLSEAKALIFDRLRSAASRCSLKLRDPDKRSTFRPCRCPCAAGRCTRRSSTARSTRAVGLAAVVVLSVSPARRRSARADADDSPDHAVSCWRSSAPTSRPCSAPG